MSLGVFDLDPSLLRSPGLGDIYGTGEPDYGLKRRRDRSNSIDQEAPSKRLPTLADDLSLCKIAIYDFRVSAGRGSKLSIVREQRLHSDTWRLHLGSERVYGDRLSPLCLGLSALRE